METILGEIRPFAFKFVPQGWLACNGQLLNVAQYQALYIILGNIYGGTPGQTFNLPNLNGRVIVGQGQAQSGTNYTLGATGGTAQVQLNQDNLPAHTHAFNVSALTNASDGIHIPTAGSFITDVIEIAGGKPNSGSYFVSGESPEQPLADTTLAPVGYGQPHNNYQPYLVINYCICIDGMYPTGSKQISNVKK